MSIDIESYLQEISSENPCGEDLEYDAEFIELEDAIKGKPEVQIGETFQEAEPPNWREIIKSCENLLERTRDLRVLVSYFRALAATEGFSGVNQAILLIKALTESRWETIHPQLDPDDDNDPTERINILMTLCDFETTLKPLQNIPLVESKVLGKFSLRDVNIAVGKISLTNADDDDDDEAEEQSIQSNIDGAVQDCEIEQLQQTVTALNESLKNMEELEKFVTEKVGIVDAPSFAELKILLKEMASVTAGWLETRGVDEYSEGIESNGEDNEQGNGSSTGSAKVAVKQIPAGINNSQDVIKALNKICEYYHKNEPSSPIPLLLKRAIGLVGKDFMEVLKNLTPDGVDQFEVLSISRDDDEE